MKILLSVLYATLISIATTSFAECPSHLNVDDMHECIMMEGNGDIDYREWAPEFYKEFNPGKVEAIRAAYEAETKNAEKKKISSLSD